MLVTVDGIVISRREIGDNNAFLDILTKEYGVIEVVAHGVKKLNSTNLGSTGLFSYATFCLNKSSLKYTLNSAKPIYLFYKLSSDLKKLSLATYFADIARYTSASEEYGGDFLRFFAMTLYRLEKDDACEALIKSVFELRTAAMLGFMPDLRACGRCVCYEHSEMFFLFGESTIVCGDCFDGNRDDEGVFTLSPSLLYTLRYVVYSPVEKLFGFSLAGVTAEQFYSFTEKYLLGHLNRSFRSLEYYYKV